MTEPRDPHDEIGGRARRAADGLRDHVLPPVDAEVTADRMPPGPRRRTIGRVAIAAVAGLLAITSLITLRDDAPGPDDDEQVMPTPVALTPLGPRDGKQSMHLPVAITPAIGLTDGATVSATGNGFEPGETVSTVQCALEAGKRTDDEPAGVEGCDATRYVHVTASSDGIATSQFEVQRFLTTPVTGVIDCASAPDRCLVAMAALSDYDRSGGALLGFAVAGSEPPVGEPPAPALVVEPSISLEDAQLVDVTATGLTPDAAVTFQVCAVDPEACWVTGPLDRPDGTATVDDDGTFRTQLPAWRYLPGPEPGTYVDCAVSVCHLELASDASAVPDKARLGFLSGGDGPVGPVVEVDPSTDIEAGTVVIVRGAGLDPSARVFLSFCIGPVDGSEGGLCIDLGDAVDVDPDDGTIDTQILLPAIADLTGPRLAPPAGEATTSPTGPMSGPCDGVTTTCVLRAVPSYGETPDQRLRPRFDPAPVPVTFRTGEPQEGTDR